MLFQSIVPPTVVFNMFQTCQILDYTNRSGERIEEDAGRHQDQKEKGSKITKNMINKEKEQDQKTQS